MKGWTSLVVLAAVLISAAAWWVESNREEEPEEGQEQPAMHAIEQPMDAHVGVSEVVATEEAAATSTTDGPVLSREPSNPLVVPFEGPYVEKELSALMTTASYYGAPRFTDGEVEVLLFQSEKPYSTQPPADALVLVRLQPDSEGRISASVPLPLNTEGEVKKGRLAFRAVADGWTIGRVRSFLSTPYVAVGSRMRSLTDLEIILEAGTHVPVRALGLNNNDQESGNPLHQGFTYRRLDHEDSDWQSVPRAREGHGDLLGLFHLSEKGKYQFRSHGLHGVGFIRSLSLDPANPPSEITMLIEEYGSLSGTLQSPFPYELEGILIHAIHESLSESSLPPAPHREDASFPPRTGSAQVQRDGSFQIFGLAPGSYRFAWSDRYSFSERDAVWFDVDAMPTGTRDVELALPVSFLELRLLDAGGVFQPMFGKAGPRVTVTRMPQVAHHWPLDVERKFHGEVFGFPVLPGNRYQVSVWGQGLGLFEAELSDPFPEGIFQLDIQAEEVPVGTLQWTGPKTDIKYEVFTEGLRQEIYSWRSYYRNRGGLETSLPPGRYLMRASGQTDGGNHGEVGYARTPYGVQEKWVEIRSNEISTLVFDPPQTGSLSIAVRSEGLASLDQPPHADWEDLDGVTPPKSFFLDKPTFVLRSKDGGQAIPLEFQSYLGGSMYGSTTTYRPGRDGYNTIPLQVFLPGEYVLETRVFGYPLVTQDVTVMAGKRTDVEVVIRNP